MRKISLLIIMILGSLFMGCAAPGEVQVAQKYQKQVLTAYASNNTKIFNTWSTIYERQYKAAIDATLEKDMALINEALAGKAPQAEIDAGVRAMIKARDVDFENMRTILAKMRLAVETNRLEFVKAMEITENLNKWMNTGMDMAAVNNMTDSVLAIINSLPSGD